MGDRVFIFFGQSNMAGEFSGTVPTHLQTLDAGIKIWTGTSWDTLNNGTNNQTLSGATGYWGPESEFGYQFRQKFPTETCYIFKYAVGTTDHTYWIPGGTGYVAITADLPAALAALTSPRIEVCLNYQGEDDASSLALANSYQADYENMIAASVSAWGTDDATRWVWYQVYTTDGRTYLSNVRAAQAALVAAKPITRTLVDTTSYSRQVDGVHCDATGYVSAGLDGFTAYQAGKRWRLSW